MKKTKEKLRQFLLAVGMSLTSIPMSAYAQEVQEPSNQEQESQEVVQEERKNRQNLLKSRRQSSFREKIRKVIKLLRVWILMEMLQKL
mgnify:CR=1 FL=1